jgi:hypothetical protein
MSTAQSTSEDIQQDDKSSPPYNEVAAEHIRQLAEYNEVKPIFFDETPEYTS